MPLPFRPGEEPFDPGCRIATTLRRLIETEAETAVVARGGRGLGRISRRRLERAIEYGLGSASLSRIIADAPQPGRATVSPSRLRERLTTGLPARDLRRLRELGRAATVAGVEAYLVGGPVRDLLLGEALRDLDVVISQGGPRLVAGLARRLGGTARRHTRFGTASIGFPDGSAIDVAAARRESYPRPAALPRVVRGSLLEDLERRDFSINAMALDLAPGRFGRLVDPLGGLQDLKARRLRVLHGLSFIEDPTRAFRAARLAGRLSLRVASRSARMIDTMLALGSVDRLSPARLRRSVELLLEERRVARVARFAAHFRLWQALQRGLRPRVARFRELDRVERIWVRHEAWIGSTGARRWVVGLGVLLGDLNERQRASLLVRLDPPRRAARVLRVAVPESERVLRRLAGAAATRPGRLHRAWRDLPVEILILAAARAPDPASRRILLRYAGQARQVRADISGTDLIRSGVAPGPAVAAGLEAALEAKLDGRASSKKDQLAVALRAAERA